MRAQVMQFVSPASEQVVCMQAACTLVHVPALEILATYHDMVRSCCASVKGIVHASVAWRSRVQTMLRVAIADVAQTV